MALRLDQALVDRGLFVSREKARRAVMAGEVLVEGRRIDKAGTAVAADARFELLVKEPYVSRSGRKLAQALETFVIDPRDKVALDVGASTGGFTDCLLQGGAARVYAVDVGYGQLDQRLRADPRVIVRERVNARFLKPEDLPEKVDLVTVDVSFISLTKIVPALIPLMAPGARLIVLIKPQFEVGRAALGKGGIVRDEAVRRQVVADRAAALAGLGLEPLGVIDSTLRGMEGNQEALAAFSRPEDEK
jgi:23S rRNA (cytidine1920-2'-O)/16S rRNA (cytidine1409-2'-O)-methyltransferase